MVGGVGSLVGESVGSEVINVGFDVVGNGVGLKVNKVGLSVVVRVGWSIGDSVSVGVGLFVGES